MKFALRSSRPQPVFYWLALVWLVLLVGIGLLAPWLPLPYTASTPDLQHMATAPAWGISPAHYLGTDPLGRDVLAGLVAGARRLVLLSLPAVVLATTTGALAGAAAGFWGNRQLRLPTAVVVWGLAGAWWWLTLPYAAMCYCLASAALVLSLAVWWQPRQEAKQPLWLTLALPLDSLVLGLVTLLGAVPRLVLLVALVAGPQLTQVQLLGVLALMAWPETARLVRGQMLRVRVQPFIEAARASGLPTGRIWWHHALPHACRPLRTFAPLSLAGLIGLESALAFLGIGQGPDIVSWGSLLASVRQDPTAWWVAVGPGITLLVTLLALQQVANANHSPASN
jgi:peptide/nickel transport system permease protein